MLSNEMPCNPDKTKDDQINGDQRNVTIEEVNRVLEIGRILLSVLTDEELEELQRVFNPDGLCNPVEK